MTTQQTTQQKLATLKADDQHYRNRVSMRRTELLEWAQGIQQALEFAYSPEQIRTALQEDERLNTSFRDNHEGLWFDVDEMLGDLDSIQRYPTWVAATHAKEE